MLARVEGSRVNRRRWIMRKRCVLVVVLSMVILGAYLLPAEGQQKGPVQEQHPQIGRFQIYMWPGQMPGLHTYLLDTATGRVWLVMTDTATEQTFWHPLEVMGGDIPWNAEARNQIRNSAERGREAVRKKKGQE
jgi:hypothetical protein